MSQRIFWRHAEAAWSQQDHERHLTARGRRQAQASGDWLDARAVDFPVFCSEALRGQETAACYRAAPTVLAGLNPGQPLSVVFATLAALGEDDAVIVGHLPWIGEVVATLLKEENDYLAVGYSALFWLASEDGKHWRLEARYRD